MKELIKRLRKWDGRLREGRDAHRAADALEKAEAMADALHNMIEVGGPQMSQSDEVNALTLKLGREALTAYRGRP